MVEERVLRGQGVVMNHLYLPYRYTLNKQGIKLTHKAFSPQSLVLPKQGTQVR